MYTGETVKNLEHLMNAKLFSVFKINKTIFRYLSWLDLNMKLMVVVI